MVCLQTAPRRHDESACAMSGPSVHLLVDINSHMLEAELSQIYQLLSLADCIILLERQCCWRGGMHILHDWDDQQFGDAMWHDFNTGEAHSVRAGLYQCCLDSSSERVPLLSQTFLWRCTAPR